MIRATIYILLFALFGLLIIVRAFEDYLFYDPYLTFFKGDFMHLDSPNPETFKLLVFTAFRYGLNTIISLAILYVFFKDKNIIKFAGIIYLIAFLVLLPVYMYFVINPKQENYYMLFNVRRFLIQPILLILLLPAFYYHKLKK